MGTVSVLHAESRDHDLSPFAGIPESYIFAVLGNSDSAAADNVHKVPNMALQQADAESAVVELCLVFLDSLFLAEPVGLLGLDNGLPTVLVSVPVLHPVSFL